MPIILNLRHLLLNFLQPLQLLLLQIPNPLLPPHASLLLSFVHNLLLYTINGLPLLQPEHTALIAQFQYFLHTASDPILELFLPPRLRLLFLL